LHLFFSCVGGLEGVGYLLFSTCSHKVLIVSSSNFQWILNISLGFQCVPQHVPNNTSLCPICFNQHCLLETYMVDQCWDSHVSTFDVNTLIEKSPKFENDAFVMGESKKLIEQKIMNLEGTHQLEFKWIMYIRLISLMFQVEEFQPISTHNPYSHPYKCLLHTLYKS
jgi:hypothetical protein